MSNLPPGCSTRDIDHAFGFDTGCDFCHRVADDCECLECECGSVGDAICYVPGKCGGLGVRQVVDHGPACQTCHPFDDASFLDDAPFDEL